MTRLFACLLLLVGTLCAAETLGYHEVRTDGAGNLGDPAVKANLIPMADYWLAHGMSPADSRHARWGNLPYPYDTGPFGPVRWRHALRQGLQPGDALAVSRACGYGRGV